MLDRTARVDEVRHGEWSREQLVQMNAGFISAVEAAFASGRESPALARSTVRVGKSRLVDQEQVIQRVWEWHIRNRDAEVPFMEIVGWVRALLPTITAERVRLGFEARRRSTVSSG
jgi:hypothetical protein